MVKIDELPIYQTCCTKIQKEDKLLSEAFLEPYVRDARQNLSDALSPLLGDYPKQASQKLYDAIDLTKETIDFIRKEENIAARAGFITGSTFLGLMIARRGFFKRIAFATLGSAGSAAICNPQLAKDYFEVSTSLAKQMADEFYHQNKETLSLDNLKKLSNSK